MRSAHVGLRLPAWGERRPWRRALAAVGLGRLEDPTLMAGQTRSSAINLTPEAEGRDALVSVEKAQAEYRVVISSGASSYRRMPGYQAEDETDPTVESARSAVR